MTAAITLVLATAFLVLRRAARRQPPVIGMLLPDHDPKSRVPFKSKRPRTG